MSFIFFSIFLPPSITIRVLHNTGWSHPHPGNAIQWRATSSHLPSFSLSSTKLFLGIWFNTISAFTLHLAICLCFHLVAQFANIGTNVTEVFVFYLTLYCQIIIWQSWSLKYMVPFLINSLPKGWKDQGLGWDEVRRYLMFSLKEKEVTYLSAANWRNHLGFMEKVDSQSCFKIQFFRLEW